MVRGKKVMAYKNMNFHMLLSSVVFILIPRVGFHSSILNRLTVMWRISRNGNTDFT